MAVTAPPLPHLLCLVLYRCPNSDDFIYIALSDNMDPLLSTHLNSLFLICGDFSCYHANWLGAGSSLTSYGTAAKDFCDSTGLTQSVNFPTQISPNGKYSFLDLVMTKFPTNVSCSFSAPIGSRDHMLVKVNISHTELP